MGEAAVGVVLVVVWALLEGVAQVFLKKSVRRAARWYLWVVSGIVILVVEKVIYSEALLFLDVGAAYAISSLNLISITFMSRYLLHEKVTKTRWTGVFLIFVGASLVALRA